MIMLKTLDFHSTVDFDPISNERIYFVDIS